jgi:hypothetical protein
MENKQSTTEQGPGKRSRVNGAHGSPAELGDAWADVTSSLGDLYRAADTFTTEQTKIRPHVVLGAAAGIGFILGGGLASRLGSTLLSVGTRLFASRFLEEMMSHAEGE